jgi:hypothetical protein
MILPGAGRYYDRGAVGDDVAGEVVSRARGDMRFYPDPTLAALCARAIKRRILA